MISDVILVSSILGMITGFVSFVCWMIRTYLSFKFHFWVKKNKYELWEYLTSADTRWGSAGPGLVNTRRSYAYFASDKDNDITFIYNFKIKHRKIERLAINATMLFMFLIILTVALSLLSTYLDNLRYEDLLR